MLVLFLQLLCSTVSLLSCILSFLFFLLLCFSMCLLASRYVPLPTSNLHFYIPLSVTPSLFFLLVCSSVCCCMPRCLCRQGESHCLAAETESSWRVMTLNDQPCSHTHTCMLYKSYTHTSLMAGAIGHMPTI